MQTCSSRRTLILAAAALTCSLSSIVAAQSQTPFQKSNSISLSTLFATGTGYGTNPLSLAVDSAGNAYVGGYNSSGAAANIGIVKISAASSAAPTVAGLTSTQFSSPSSRGIDALASTGGDVFMLHDSGSAATSFISRVDNAGTTAWQKFDPSGIGARITAMAIDPTGDAGNPAVAFFGTGQGRRASLKTADGALDYTFSGGANPGAIINASPALTNQGNWRAMAFDSAGNIATGAEYGFGVGARVSTNQFSTLDGATPNAVSRVILKGTGLNNVGNGITFIQGAATDELIAFSPRATGTGAGGSVQLTDGTGGVQTVNSKYVQIRQTRGQNGYLSQLQLTGAEDGLSGEFGGEVKNFATGVDANGQPVLYVIDYFAKRLDVYTLEPQWNADADGTWSTGSRWLTGFVPDSATTNATFGGKIAAPRTVTVDSARTVKQLKFDNANRYTLSGTATITLAAPANDSLPAYITVKSGSHTVNAPIVFTSNGRFDIATGSTLSLGTVDAPGRGLTLAPAGSTGTGTLEATHIRTSTLVLNAGATKMTGTGNEAGISRVADLQLNGGTLDLGANGLIVDYPTTATSPYATLEAAVKGGIISSSLTDSGKTLGIIEYGTATVPTFSDPGLIIDSTSVLIRYTLRGDANLDKTVNFDDLLSLAQNYDVAGTGKIWANGDFNYDGVVNFDDLLALAQNYNGSLVSDGSSLLSSGSDFAADFALAASLVPEPASLAALTLGGLLVRRRR